MGKKPFTDISIAQLINGVKRIVYLKNATKVAPPESLQQADGVNGAQATFNGRVPQKSENVKAVLFKNSKANLLGGSMISRYESSFWWRKGILCLLNIY